MLVLTIDVGAGTNDILVWDREKRGENQTHLIVPSSTRVVAGEITRATRRGLAVVFRGPLMGGGPSTGAMRRHVAQGLAFYADPWAARTFSDDLQEAAAMGVTVVGEEEAERLAESEEVVPVRSGDVRLEQLLHALRLLGETREPEGFAVAVQDHGEAPRGLSDRVFRFEKLTEALRQSRRLPDLFYPADRIPRHFTRMTAAAACFGEAGPLVVGDTGPAALWGAALAAPASDCLAVNYGNSHTLMAVIRGEELDGLFEHHTSALGPAAMEAYLRSFAAGSISGEQVLGDGGHGAFPPAAPVDLGATEIVATGPNRSRFSELQIPQTEASLHGDMMLTGCWGLLQGFLTQRPV